MSESSSTATPRYDTPVSHRNLFLLPWTVAPQASLFGTWWALLPAEDLDDLVVAAKAGAAIIDTCGHQHQTEESLQGCSNVSELRELAHAHAEGLADLAARTSDHQLHAYDTDMFRRLF